MAGDEAEGNEEGEEDEKDGRARYDCGGGVCHVGDLPSDREAGGR